jgi:predicted ATPase/DNA-binding SARP family transcriptional activator
LLIYLAVTGEPHQRETLATLFWPDYNRKHGRNNLRRIVWKLRKALGEACLQVEGDTICLRQTADVWTDLAEFKMLLSQGADQQGPLQPTTLAALEKAIVLYRGDFLAGFTLPDSPAFDEWQFFETDTARQKMFEGLDALMQHYVVTETYDRAIPHTRHRLALDPLHEPAHQTLMRLYALSGRRAAALRQFDECQRVLQAELDLAPDTETIALAAAIREKRLTLPGQTEQRLSITDPPHLQALLDDSEPRQPPLGERPLFVGREPELTQLEQALSQAQAGQGQLRIITGEAGSGKSALVTEFSHRLAADQTDLLIAVGSCDAQTGALDPYLPFREALSLLIGYGDKRAATLTQPQQAQVITSRALLEHGPHLLSIFVPISERENVITTAQASGWQGEPPQTTAEQNLEQSRIFEQTVAVLQAVAAQIPLLLVLEDLHWADSGSLGLLFRLVRQLEGSCLFIIGTYRSEAVSMGYQGEAHPLEQMVLEVQRNLGDVYIDLEAVRQREGLILVDGVLDAEPNHLNASFRQALHAQTQGHPLFVVELVQDLKKRGALVQDQAGVWKVGTQLDWQNLPARIEGIIAGRMTHLSEEQRWFLTIASVIGEHFQAEVVAQVAGAKPRQLVQTLSRLLQNQHQLVEAEGVERLGEGRLTRYRFRHHLMQTYLYEGLDEGQRIYLHEDVAQALEGFYGKNVEPVALQLARHYEAAGVAPKAIDYLILASEQAVRMAANEEAAQHFTQALSLLPTLPKSLARDQQELALQFNLGRVLAASKGFAAPEVGEAYTYALALGRQLEEPRQITQVLNGLAQHALYRSELTLAQTYGQECLRLATEGQDLEHLLEANQILRRIAHNLGQHAEAVTYGEQVIAFYRVHRPSLTFEDTYALAFMLAAMGLNLVPVGYPDRALRQAQEGLILAQSQAHHFGTTYCFSFMAYIHLLRGDWQEALHFAEAGYQVSAAGRR